MAQSPAQFIASGLASHDEVAQANPIDDRRVEVQRKKYPHFNVGVVSQVCVTPDVVTELAHDRTIDFICNLPRECVWVGEAIDIVRSQGKAWGGVADLYSAAAREEQVRDFVRAEFRFIERVFAQHSNVTHVERLYDRVYRLHRRGMADVDVALLNEYDLTADHVRTAVERYGTLTDILANNPNCRFTPQAVEASRQIGVKMMMLRNFMGRLNTQ